MEYRFGNEEFIVISPEENHNLYVPLVNEKVMSCITVDGHGDNKISQNHFLLEPTSIEDLHTSMVTRNFWCQVGEEKLWSVFGYSLEQQKKNFLGQEEVSKVRVGNFWQEVERVWEEKGIKSKVLSFCPARQCAVEIMIVELKNESNEEIEIVATAAVPIYGRGADHIRDHRHVTSLLNRVILTEDGVKNIPSMAFDERGHHRNKVSYGVYGREENGNVPETMIGTVEEFVGDGGNLLAPKALRTEERWRKAGEQIDGFEAMGALRFQKISLKPDEKYEYVVLLSYNEEGMEYLDIQKAKEAFHEMKQYWKKKKVIHCSSKNQEFDQWVDWISLQPSLRRIYGCSFLPHHDYGRGGRGWRDLWQDCLALILMNPKEVRSDLVAFFEGIRIDGTNATIIGNKPGKFVADRNSIVRVWMDHAYWPFRTVVLYMEQTGDYSILMEEKPYFKDRIWKRGEQVEEFHDEKESVKNVLYTREESVYYGSIFEHLLLQQLTQFFDVGCHNHMRLHGADWNDALDMAAECGESVAFTAAYSENLKRLAQLCYNLKDKMGIKTISVFNELTQLLDVDTFVYDQVEEKNRILQHFCESCTPNIEGVKVFISLEQLAKKLENMGEWIQEHIRNTEVVGDGGEHLWFNGYYDNQGKQVEGKEDGIVKMMLTSQVFTILSGTATDEQVDQIHSSAKTYLYAPEVGGYRLNTDFKENRMNLGRMFGFAYGSKENGAVFSHMAIMYAYALYERNFIKEGYDVIRSLFEKGVDFQTSCMYPGIPEYFDQKGRGLYAYLTGAGSWFVLTVLTQMYGVRGVEGDLLLEPKLLKEQFDEKGIASISCRFADRELTVCYWNQNQKEIGDYEIEGIYINDQPYYSTLGIARIRRDEIEKLSKEIQNEIKIILE